MLEQPNLAVLKGGGGEFERHLGKAAELYGLRGQTPFEITLPPHVSEKSRLSSASFANLTPIWQEQTTDAFAEASIAATTGAALYAIGAADTLPAAEALAQDLWQSRLLAPAA